MRKIFFFSFALLLLCSPVVLPSSVSAQVGECSDKKDNDGDKKIDTNGVHTMVGSRNAINIEADPECKVAGAVCENGNKTTPCVVVGSGTDSGGSNPGSNTDSGGSLAGTQTTDAPLRVKFNNPLKVDTIQDALKLFMDAVVRIAIVFIVVFFMWSGLKFILARGNATEITKAKNMFWYTLIGTLLILGAWAITDAIVGTINSIAS